MAPFFFNHSGTLIVWPTSVDSFKLSSVKPSPCFLINTMYELLYDVSQSIKAATLLEDRKPIRLIIRIQDGIDLVQATIIRQ
jgi:hypothetical protein